MFASKQAERLQATDLKVINPNVAIVDAVERNCRHLSTKDIYQQLVDSHPSLPPPST